MNSVVAKLAARPGSKVVLTQGCDDLCTACPHNRDGVCASLEKVTAMDAAVLAACGLAYAETAPWEELACKA